jgi:hypothetical protein
VSSSVLAPTRLPAPPSDVDVRDGFASGAVGHGGIEIDALSRIIGTTRARAAYFGNWCRDLSQLITPVSVHVLGERAALLNTVVFELVSVLAEATYGRRLDRIRFGSYRWEEHLDNPRGYGVAVDPRTYQLVTDRRPMEHEPERSLEPWVQDADGLPAYFHRSRAYVLRQLAAAAATHDDARRLEHFGNAMHVVEDFYAHSNFVELAILQLGGRADPMAGWYAGSRDPVRDTRGRIRLTTGVFLSRDTVVSLEKLLIGTIEGQPSMPGEPNLSTSLRRVLIRRLLSQTALDVYDRATATLERTRLPALGRRIIDLSGVPALKALLERQVEQPLRAAVAGLLRPLSEAASRQPVSAPTGVVIGGVRRRVIEVSHSQVAKDDHHRPLHPAARLLAVQAVREFWIASDRMWRGGPPADYPALLRLYTAHPADCGTWWQGAVRPLVGVPFGPPAPSRQHPVPSPRPVPLPSTAGPRPRPASGSRPLLRVGAREPAVALAQNRLNVWLLTQPGRVPLVVDGVFGRRTFAAVRAFQQAHGLPADGLVGRRTWAALGP